MPDQAEIHEKCISEKIEDRRKAAELLRSHFSNLLDKDQAWKDLCSLILDNDNSVRRVAARTLKEAFNQVPDKERAWQDLLRFMRISDSFVRLEVGRALKKAFNQIPDKKQSWSDLAELIMLEPFEAAEGQRRIILEKFEASRALKEAFSHVPYNKQAYQDLLQLMHDEDSHVRISVVMAVILSQRSGQRMNFQAS